MNGINGGVNNSLGSQGNNPTGSNSYRRKRFLQKLIGVITCNICSLFIFRKKIFFIVFEISFWKNGLYYYYISVVFKESISITTITYK